MNDNYSDSDSSSSQAAPKKRKIKGRGKSKAEILREGLRKVLCFEDCVIFIQGAACLKLLSKTPVKVRKPLDENAEASLHKWILLGVPLQADNRVLLKLYREYTTKYSLTLDGKTHAMSLPKRIFAYYVIEFFYSDFKECEKYNMHARNRNEDPDFINMMRRDNMFCFNISGEKPLCHSNAGSLPIANTNIPFNEEVVTKMLENRNRKERKKARKKPSGRINWEEEKKNYPFAEFLSDYVTALKKHEDDQEKATLRLFEKRKAKLVSNRGARKHDEEAHSSKPAGNLHDEATNGEKDPNSSRSLNEEARNSEDLNIGKNLTKEAINSEKDANRGKNLNEETSKSKRDLNDGKNLNEEASIAKKDQNSGSDHKEPQSDLEAKGDGLRIYVFSNDPNFYDEVKKSRDAAVAKHNADEDTCQVICGLPPALERLQNESVDVAKIVEESNDGKAEKLHKVTNTKKESENEVDIVPKSKKEAEKKAKISTKTRNEFEKKSEIMTKTKKDLRNDEELSDQPTTSYDTSSNENGEKNKIQTSEKKTKRGAFEKRYVDTTVKKPETKVSHFPVLIKVWF